MEEALRSWVEARGGFVHNGVELAASLGAGHRGVRAREKIAKDSELLRLPVSACMHVPFEDGSKPEDAVLSHLVSRRESLDPFLATTLLLMAEKAKGDASEYCAHIRSMPESHGCTLAWPSEALALLVGTELAGDGGEDVQGAWEAAEREMAARRDLWPEEACTRAAFLWAAGMVQSRAFHIQANNWCTGQVKDGTDLFLIPAVDMLNHSTDPARRATELAMLGGASTGAKEAPDAQPQFVMRAGRDVAAGEEILHTYGDLSDGELVKMYGFVEPPSLLPGGRNPHDYVTVSPDALPALARATLGIPEGRSKARLETLRKLKVIEGRLRVEDDDGIPPQLATLAQALVAEDDDFDAFVAAIESKGVVHLPVSSADEEALRLIMAAADARSRERPCDLPAGDVDPELAQMATRVAEGERRRLLELKKAAFLTMAQGDDSDDSDEEDGSDASDDDEQEKEVDVSSSPPFPPSSSSSDEGGSGPPQVPKASPAKRAAAQRHARAKPVKKAKKRAHK